MQKVIISHGDMRSCKIANFIEIAPKGMSDWTSSVAITSNEVEVEGVYIGLVESGEYMGLNGCYCTATKKDGTKYTYVGADRNSYTYLIDEAQYEKIMQINSEYLLKKAEKEAASKAETLEVLAKSKAKIDAAFDLAKSTGEKQVIRTGFNIIEKNDSETYSYYTAWAMPNGEEKTTYNNVEMA